jgi:hypothetical protein
VFTLNSIAENNQIKIPTDNSTVLSVWVILSLFENIPSNPAMIEAKPNLRPSSPQTCQKSALSSVNRFNVLSAIFKPIFAPKKTLSTKFSGIKEFAYLL